MHQPSLPRFRTLAAMAEAGNLRPEDVPVLGYTKTGRPIYLVGGGDGTGDPGEGDPGEGEPGKAGGTGSGAGGTKPLAEMTPEEQAEHWKKMARKHERAAKAAPTAEELAELRNAKTELDKLTDANKSETEKATSRADKAEKELADLKPKYLRMEVALAKGLPSNLVHRLVGATKEELEADADDLMATLGTGAGNGTGAGAGNGAGSGKRGQDGGVRGTAKDTKASVDSGADLFNSRHKRAASTTADA